MKAQDIIDKLGLIPLPEEGGFFKETFRDTGRFEVSTPLYEGGRSFSTCIYYLITPQEFSGLHLVESTEIFHFYGGDPVKMVQIEQDGSLDEVILGPDFMNGQKPQHNVAPRIWQGTKLLEGGEWALLGCTVAPGFELDDFTGGTFATLSEKFPQHSDIIKQYTHS